MRARRLGLPFLAEGEEPIPADDEVEAEAVKDSMSAKELAGLEAYSPGADALADPAYHAEEERKEQDPSFQAAQPEPVSVLDGLWMAYYEDFSDVLIFGSELEALRYAVNLTMRVKPLELGKSIRDQVS